MRIVSFDLFDTLITRLVAHPFDIFIEVGEELRERNLITISAGQFAAARAAAESSARQGYEHREVNLEEIYQLLSRQLNWNETTVLAAIEIEIAAEKKSIRMVPPACRLLREARASADRILFISDMYLPAGLLEEILRAECLWEEGDLLYVSHEHRKSKASGELYRQIKTEFPGIISWTHHGDNLRSDIQAAAKYQISSNHFRGCALTRYEQVFRSGNVGPLWSSRMAGAMRHTRLARPESADPVIWELGANVPGPALFAFVAWCLREALKLRLNRLYFISREGEVLARIGSVLCEAWNLPIECRYLYGSRQAWHLPAMIELTEAEKKWVIGPSQLMHVRASFARLGLAPEHFEQALRARNLPASEWDRNLNPSERETLWNLLLTPALKSAAEQEAASRRALTLAYLRQEGLCSNDAFAIVDIGWYGNLQRSLRKLLTLAQPEKPNLPLNGFYFALIEKRAASGDRFEAFWNTFNPHEDYLKFNTAFWEAFTTADHGSVIRYQEQNGDIIPVLEQERNDRGIEWGVLDLQNSMVELARTLSAQIPLEGCDLAAIAQKAKAVYDLFYKSPSASEALKWGKFPFKNQANEIIQDNFVPAWGELDIARALLDYEKRPTCWWMEGSLAVRRSPSLALFLFLKKLKNRLKNRRP
jgi:FMN phosphatase YigB (HAD superfamily)